MNTTSENILTIKGLSKAFAGVKALDNVSFEIRRGEIHCLAGENGSGKSTLIKLLSGAYQPDSGEFTIGENTYQSITPAESMRQGIQVIYQDFSVFPNLTVAENIAMNAIANSGKQLISWKAITETAKKAVDRVNFKIDIKEKLENLSVADKQMTAICRAIANDAKLIIMDEPTSSLTKKEVVSLFEVIRNLQEKGIAILFVSHKMDEVFEISERFTMLRSGKKIITADTEELDYEKFVYYMTGRTFRESLYEPKIDPNETPVLEVRNLCLQRSFKDVSFSVRRGEILGIAGLLGSGRKEVALTLFGYYPATSGTILLNGKEIPIKNIRSAIKNKIGHVPEDRLTEGLSLQQSIEDNVAAANIGCITNRYGIIQEKQKEDLANSWCKEIGVVMADQKNKVSTLSGGNQQKVVLGKWLACDPSVLILNGPTVGVDIGSKFDIHNLLKGLADKGMALIVISDDIPELMVMCNRIKVMRFGQITDEIIPSDSSEDELMNLMSADYIVDSDERIKES